MGPCWILDSLYLFLFLECFYFFFKILFKNTGFWEVYVQYFFHLMLPNIWFINLISKVVFFSLFYFLEIFEIVFWILMYPFWKSMLYILLFKESLYILLFSNLMWALWAHLVLNISKWNSNENIDLWSQFFISFFICSLLVYVPYFLKLSWSFSKLIFFCLLLLKIRIPTIRKASFIEFFTLVLLFTRIVQFQLIPIGSCWHHLQVIYPIEQAEPVI